jgi:hypothetical protein
MRTDAGFQIALMRFRRQKDWSCRDVKSRKSRRHRRRGGTSWRCYNFDSLNRSLRLNDRRRRASLQPPFYALYPRSQIAHDFPQRQQIVLRIVHKAPWLISTALSAKLERLSSYFG